MNGNKKVVFIAMSSKMFRLREWITKFVFDQGAIPVNCLMIYGYYLYDMVPRVRIIEAYKAVVVRCDEIWTFGDVSDGVRDAMAIARKNKMHIRHFDTARYPEIVEVSENQLVYEEGVSFG